MAVTNFARLTDEQLTIWSRDTWSAAREQSLLNRFMGDDENSMIQRITELKKTEKGARAVITLVADLTQDGQTGDNQLEGNEESMSSYEQVIQIDQLRHGVAHEGQMAEQRSVVTFRNQAKNKLAYWLTDRIDQLMFLTLAGWSYSKHPRGATRVASNLVNLDFAADVKAPSARRFGRWNKTSGNIEWGTGTSALTAADIPTWNMLVDMRAYARGEYVKGIRESGNEEVFHVFLSEQAMKQLKKDPDYVQNLRHAAQRDKENPLFTGNTVKVDGLYIHEHRYVPNTANAPSGQRWGSGGAVHGCQVMLCGAQALGMADIGDGKWVEKGFDYDNRQGIALGKMVGLLKPTFYSIYSKTVEDFGVVSVYVAQ